MDGWIIDGGIFGCIVGKIDQCTGERKPKYTSNISHLALCSDNRDPGSPFCVAGVSQTACPESHTAAIEMGAQYGLTRKHTASHCGAAIHAASRMPVHKITMTRKRQRTVLFCTGILTHHNTHALYSLVPGLNGFVGVSA